VGIRDQLRAGLLGFGAAPLGNMFRNIPEEEAAATVDAAWQQGTRYFDTAPLYGAGLSEIRLGKALTKHKRDEYLLSTKVGRLILDEIESDGRDFGEKGDLFEFGRPNRIVYDYTEDGALRSIQDSLKRLGVDRLDFVWVHDVAQDFHGDEWLARFETARTRAFRALTRLREQDVIKAWGLGVNRVEPCELTLDLAEANPDGFLLAGRYKLLDHSAHCSASCRPPLLGRWKSLLAAPIARASSPAAPTSSTRRRPLRSSPRLSGSRRSLNVIRCPSKPSPYSSPLLIPPRRPSSRARAVLSASRKTMLH